MFKRVLLAAAALTIGAFVAVDRTAVLVAQGDSLKPAPNRRADEGKGPFKTLVIRGVMLIDGTGAPPQGPVDVVVSGNRIAAIRSAGTPASASAPSRTSTVTSNPCSRTMSSSPGRST